MTKRILLAHNDQTVLSTVPDLLSEHEHQVRITNTASQTLKAAENWRPDLILQDVAFDDMSGFDLCQQLREMPATAHVPIIILSEHDDIKDKARGFDAGADDYLGVPFNAMEFTLRVEAQLRRMGRLPTGMVESQGKVIAVHSLRGGVGCSSLAVNLAVGFHELWQRPTMLVDMCLPVGVCDIVLKMHGSRTIGDLGGFEPEQIDRDVVEDIALFHESGIRLISGNRYPPEAELITDNHIRRLITLLRNEYDYIVLDLPHDFSGPALAALEECDTIISPMTPDIVSVRNMQATFRIFDALQFDEGQIVIIVNSVFPEGGLSQEQVERTITHPIKLYMPYDPAWVSAANLGKTMVSSESSPAAARKLDALTWNLSQDVHRRKRPSQPSIMWERIAERIMKKRAQVDP